MSVFDKGTERGRTQIACAAGAIAGLATLLFVLVIKWGTGS